MKKIIISLGLCFLSVSSFAEFYKFTMEKKVEQNLYLVSSSYAKKFLVKTKFCFEFPMMFEDVILIFEGRYGDNKLIFKNGTSCDVEAVYEY